MSKDSPRITYLKSLLRLEEQRSALQQELQTVLAEISQLSAALSLPATSKAPAAAPSVAKRPTAPRGRRRGRAARGALKARILELLQAAGKAGTKVTDIAATLGTKPVNIHAWFHSTGRKVKGLRKVGRGRYALAVESAAAEPAPAEAVPAKPAKRARRVKRARRAKQAKPAAAKARRKPGRRGALKAQILSALKAAGKSGVSLKELTTQTKTPYRNLSIWFATTGKRTPGVKKLSPGVYTLKA
jgi:hypothetical protein